MNRIVIKLTDEQVELLQAIREKVALTSLEGEAGMVMAQLWISDKSMTCGFVTHRKAKKIQLILGGSSCTAYEAPEPPTVNKYIVIENSDLTGGNVPADPDSITGGFESVELVEKYILFDAKDSFSMTENDPIGKEFAYGSRYTIARIIKTVRPDPTVDVKFRMVDCGVDFKEGGE